MHGVRDRVLPPPPRHLVPARLTTPLHLLLASWLGLCLAALPVLARQRCAMSCEREVTLCKKRQCATLAGRGRRACVEACRGRAGCPAAIRTLAYVVTACRQGPNGTTGHQELVIRRGDCDPVSILSADGPQITDPFLGFGGVCQLFGRLRAGYRSVLAGALPRIGVSPDGSTVIFELTTDFSPLPDAFPLPIEEGVYVVGADGRGLRRLGDPSRHASSVLVVHTNPDGSLSLGGTTYDVLYRFSPDGRTIVFTDRGPDETGKDAVQIVALDLASGTRTQLTHLPATPAVAPDPEEPVTFQPRFVDDETVVFFTYTDADGQHPDGGYFTVRKNGTGFRAIPTPVALPGSRVLPTFDIGGKGTNVLGVLLPGVPTDRPGSSFRELFLLDGKNLLQLTNFRRTDTGFGGKVLDRRAGRAFFSASPDVFGTNPSQNCQLFSIDVLGGRLRQLTHFREAERSLRGCFHSEPPGCSIGPVYQDAVTRTLVFYSSCDAFGTNTYGGQVFAMRPDGTGLRQLTATRGFTTEADGTFAVELPGPVTYSALDGGR